LPANKDVKKLHAQFHGKYRLVNVMTSAPVDANLDGISSNSLLGELPEIEDCNLEILITNTGFLFGQFWPEPYFPRAVIPATYEPSLYPVFARQSAGRLIQFNEELTEIFQLADPVAIDTFRFPRANAILIQPQEQIQVGWHKSFYTTSGWKNVEVTAVYRRYTTVT